MADNNSRWLLRSLNKNVYRSGGWAQMKSLSNSSGIYSPQCLLKSAGKRNVNNHTITTYVKQ